MRSDRCFRAFRVAVFAAVCVLFAALGHALMSGAGLPWWALTVAFVVTGAVSWAVSGRERGVLAVTSAAMVVQAGLHATFTLSQVLANPAPPPTGGSFTERWAQLLLGGAERWAEGAAAEGGVPANVGTAAPAAEGGFHHPAHAMGEGMTGATTFGEHAATGMLVAHLLAALLCSLWLAYGERAVFRVLRALAGWFLTPLRLVVVLPAPSPPGTRLPRGHRSRTLKPLLLGHTVTSRGPPRENAVL